MRIRQMLDYIPANDNVVMISREWVTLNITQYLVLNLTIPVQLLLGNIYSMHFDLTAKRKMTLRTASSLQHRDALPLSKQLLSFFEKPLINLPRLLVFRGSRWLLWRSTTSSNPRIEWIVHRVHNKTKPFAFSDLD